MSDQPAEWYRWDGRDLLLFLRVQPRASRDQLVGPHGDHFKLRITAPPVEGKANEHLVKYLAKLHKLPRSQVVLESGDSARTKRIRIITPGKTPFPVD